MTQLYARLKRILFIVAAIIVLAVPLMFLMENFVRDAIVTPAAYVVWLFSVVIEALPDAYLLGFAVAVVLYVAVRSLFRESEASDRRTIPHTPVEGSATTWLRKLQLVTRGSYSAQRLEHHIGQLLLRVIAYENRCTMREAAELVEHRQLELSPELREYLDAALSRRLPRSPNLLERLKALIFGRQRRIDPRTIALELEPALGYLEHELKIRSPEEESE